MTNNSDFVKGYSIWLIPEDETCKKLQAEIDHLSRHFSSPPFIPHITLLGQLDMEEEVVRRKFFELSTAANQMTLGLGEIVYQDVFFRSIVYHVEETETLMELNQMARSKFRRDSDPPFFPHLSLLYSHEGEAAKRHAINTRGITGPSSIIISRLELVHTLGRVEDWETILRLNIK